MRFNEEMSGGEGEGQNDSNATDEEGNKKSDSKLTDYVTHMSLKRHTSLFHNALRRKTFLLMFARAITKINRIDFFLF